ncbi:hypothetical protein B1B12_12770, partial [Cutibacterium acnes subsp. defendens]
VPNLFVTPRRLSPSLRGALSPGGATVVLVVTGQILPRLVPDVACADDAPTSTGSRRVVVSRGWPHSG